MELCECCPTLRRATVYVCTKPTIYRGFCVFMPIFELEGATEGCTPSMSFM